MRICASRCLCFLAFICGIGFFGITSQANAKVLQDGVYLIQMAGSDMTVAARSSSKGSRVVLWPYKPTATWRFTHLGNDVYKISTNAMVLDVCEGKRKNGVPIIIWNWHGGGNQKWKVRRSGQYYTLTNTQTGLALDLSGNNRYNQAPFQGYQPNTSMAQKFSITRPGQRSPRAPLPKFF